MKTEFLMIDEILDDEFLDMYIEHIQYLQELEREDK